MPWRLVGFIFFFGIVLVFSICNGKNSCDISLGFTVLENVPVYFTVFFSFFLGLICSVPYMVAARLKARAKTKAASGDDGREKSLFKKKNPGALPPEGAEEEKKYPDDGTYGID